MACRSLTCLDASLDVFGLVDGCVLQFRVVHELGISWLVSGSRMDALIAMPAKSSLDTCDIGTLDAGIAGPVRARNGDDRMQNAHTSGNSIFTEICLDR